MLINWQHNASLMKQSIYMTTKSLANNGRIQRGQELDSSNYM